MQNVAGKAFSTINDKWYTKSLLVMEPLVEREAELFLDNRLNLQKFYLTVVRATGG